MKEQYDVFSPLHKEIGFSPLSEFSWLTDDKLVQKSVFDDKVEIIVNFSDKEFSYREKQIPAESVLIKWKESGKDFIYSPKI